MNAKTAPPTAPVTDAPPPAAPRKRRRALLILLLFIVIAGLAVAAWYFLYAVWKVDTDDAYVQGDIVPVSSPVPGTLIEVRAQDGDRVQPGDVLARLDPTDAEVVLAEAKAALANAVRQSHGLFSQANSAESELAARRQSYLVAKSAYERRAALARTGAVSGEELDQSRQAFESAQSAYDIARQQFDARRVLVAGTELSSQPAVEMAAARLRAAYINARRSAIVSPIAGYVARRNAQVGQRVAPGQALLAVVPLQEVWVDANFKETQLEKLRIGQPVSMTADTYGSEVTYSGKIASLGMGTGSAFSLLPAQNATGNWIKIVQRIPVRVVFDDPRELKAHPLRLGMSVAASVNVREQSGPLLAQESRPRPVQQTDVYAHYSAKADELVQAIILANRPSPAAAKGKAP